MKRIVMAALSGALILAGSALCAVLWSHSYWSVAQLAAGGLIVAAFALCF